MFPPWNVNDVRDGAIVWVCSSCGAESEAVPDAPNNAQAGPAWARALELGWRDELRELDRSAARALWVFCPLCGANERQRMYENGLFRGSRIRVRLESTDSGEEVWAVMLENRYRLAELYQRDWANALAETCAAFIPEGVGAAVALRHVSNGILSLASLRFVLAGVLERAAELRKAAAIEAIDPRERWQLFETATVLTAQAEALKGENNG